MTHRQRHAVGIGKALQGDFEESRAVAVTATSIRQHQHVFGLWISRTAIAEPPVFDTVSGKTCGIRRGSHGHGATVAVDIVDRVGRGPALGVVEEVIGIDGLGFPAPDGTGIFEVAHQFLLLGIHAYHRQARSRELLALLLDVLKLRIAIRMRRASLAFTVGFQGEFPFPQQACRRVWTRRMPQLA